MTYYLGMTRIDESVSRMTKRDRSGRSIPKQIMPIAGGDICRHKYVEHNLPFIEIYASKPKRSPTPKELSTYPVMKVKAVRHARLSRL